MNLKRSIVLMSTLALVIVFSTAMISRNTDNVSTKTEKVVPEKKKRWTSKGRDLVWANLTKPLSKKYKVNLKRQVMSRCATGLLYRLKEYAVKNGNYFYGTMYKYSGCSKGKFICKFRVDATQSQIQIFDTKKRKYTNHSQWLMAYAKPRKAKRY